MDGGVFELVLFAGATFVAATVAGIAGFAFAPICASVWLHIFTPLETATLTVGYNILVQSYGTWRMRHAFDWSRLWPFILGGPPGVAVGILVLRHADPATMRIAVGVFLVVYALYGLLRPAVKPIRVGAAGDTVAALVGGSLGAMAGFPGIMVVIWCSLRGWTKDVQRAVFQSVSVALLTSAAVTLVASGSITRPIVERFAIGLPALLLGTWVGFALYGRVDEDMFRKILLMLLLASGLFLLASLW